MPASFNPLLPVLDVLSRFLPASLSSPLYTLASFDLVSLRDHPTQLVPLALSLLAAYTALLSTLSTLRFALRTSVFFAKWGGVAAVISAAYMAYQGVGTDKGAVGGVQDAAHYAQLVGRGVYSLGRKGAAYYFGGGGSTSPFSASSSSRNKKRTTAAPVGSHHAASWDTRDADAEDFVSNALGGVLEFLNPTSGGSGGDKAKRFAKRAAAGALGGESVGRGGGNGGLGGFAWDMAMGKAQKVWDEVVGGAEEQTGKKNKRW